jgi:D,D-heptose 1,7-bisphosphate phosphatase
MNRAIFLDRDGVLNYDVGYPFRTTDFRLIQGVSKPLIKAQKLGFKLFIVTNQSAVARGYCSVDDVEIFNSLLIKTLSNLNVNIHDIRLCPHHPDGKILEFRSLCNCRKPNPGMINDLCNAYEIDRSRSFMIGDSVSDVNAGNAAKLKKSFQVPSNTIGALERCIYHILHQNSY